jgi:hypothetical protein
MEPEDLRFIEATGADVVVAGLQISETSVTVE